MKTFSIHYMSWSYDWDDSHGRVIIQIGESLKCQIVYEEDNKYAEYNEEEILVFVPEFENEWSLVRLLNWLYSNGYTAREEPLAWEKQGS